MIVCNCTLLSSVCITLLKVCLDPAALGNRHGPTDHKSDIKYNMNEDKPLFLREGCEVDSSIGDNEDHAHDAQVHCSHHACVNPQIYFCGTGSDTAWLWISRWRRRCLKNRQQLPKAAEQLGPILSARSTRSLHSGFWIYVWIRMIVKVRFVKGEAEGQNRDGWGCCWGLMLVIFGMGSRVLMRNFNSLLILYYGMQGIFLSFLFVFFCEG